MSKGIAGITVRVVAVLTLLAVFNSACTLDDILRALTRLCATPVFEVTTTTDIATGLCTTSGCSLRQAVITSNACPGTQSIHVPAGTYLLSHVGSPEEAARTGDLDITDSVQILGEDGAIVDGNSTDRVFDVFAGTTVDMTGLTVQHGVSDDGGGIRSRGILRLHNMTLQENEAIPDPDPTLGTGGGGGVLSEGEGTLTLDGSQVIGNTAFGGGGVAVYANGTSPVVAEILDSVIAENDATSTGGGLWLDVAVTISLTNVDIRDNAAASDRGDGIWNASTLTLDHVHIFGNHGGIYGGGIYNEPAGAITARYVLMENNHTRYGGGLYNRGVAHFFQSAIVNNEAERGQGGGVFNSDTDATLTVDNTTIGANRAVTGGGIFNNLGASYRLVFVTVASNSPDGLNGSGGGELKLLNSIVSGNSGGNCTGTTLPASEGYNIDSGTTCGFAMGSDLVSTDPLLMPLGSYGGITPLYALDLGSPAIDSADPDRCEGIDQIDTARPQGPRCDRGSYEHSPVGSGASPNDLPTDTPTPTPEPTATAAPMSFGAPSVSLDHFYYGQGDCIPTTLTLRVSISDPGQVSGVVLFFHLTDKAGGGSTDWNEGVDMTPVGQGTYQYDLASASIPGFSSYPEAWFLYQFVATGPDSGVLLRSDVFSNVTLFQCKN